MRRRTKFLILFLLFSAAAFLWLRSAGRGPAIAKNSYVVLDVAGEYVEAPPQDLLGRLLSRSGRTLIDLLMTIRTAKADDRIRGMIVRVGELKTGWGKLLDIREALADFKKSGKPLLSLMELEAGSSNAAYYIASVCDRVYLPPSATAPLNGLAGHFIFLGGVWEKLDIEMNVEKIAEYKTFGEMIGSKEMSPANREMSNSLLDSINEHFVNTIAQARNLDAETVHRLIDSAPISAEQFIDAKLADGSKYLEDLQEELGGKETPLVALDDYSRVDPESMKLNRGPKIAVVFAVGGIVTGRSHSSAQGQMLGARTVSEALQEAADDDDIKAIIFRIDSPGGSALASDLVWRATQSAKKRKPVIVSMSDVAGSGGYYIAAGASRILAQPTTFTGSIGVVFARPYIHGLLQKIGVNTETITRGRFAAVDDLTTPLDAEEREKLLQEIHHIYDVFVQRVAEGRKLSAEQVNEIGRGRVWTGTQANRNGLVDEIGGFRAAVQAAKQASALPLDGEVKLVFFPRHKSLLERVSETLENGEAAALPPVLRDLLKLSPPLDLRGALTLMPQRIEIQ